MVHLDLVDDLIRGEKISGKMFRKLLLELGQLPDDPAEVVFEPVPRNLFGRDRPKGRKELVDAEVVAVVEDSFGAVEADRNNSARVQNVRFKKFGTRKNELLKKRLNLESFKITF